MRDMAEYRRGMRNGRTADVTLDSPWHENAPAHVVVSMQALRTPEGVWVVSIATENRPRQELSITEAQALADTLAVIVGEAAYYERAEGEMPPLPTASSSADAPLPRPE